MAGSSTEELAKRWGAGGETVGRTRREKAWIASSSNIDRQEGEALTEDELIEAREEESEQVEEVEEVEANEEGGGGENQTPERREEEEESRPTTSQGPRRPSMPGSLPESSADERPQAPPELGPSNETTRHPGMLTRALSRGASGLANLFSPAQTKDPPSSSSAVPEPSGQPSSPIPSTPTPPSRSTNQKGKKRAHFAESGQGPQSQHDPSTPLMPSSAEQRRKKKGEEPAHLSRTGSLENGREEKSGTIADDLDEIMQRVKDRDERLIPEMDKLETLIKSLQATKQNTWKQGRSEEAPLFMRDDDERSETSEDPTFEAKSKHRRCKMDTWADSWTGTWDETNSVKEMAPYCNENGHLVARAIDPGTKKPAWAVIQGRTAKPGYCVALFKPLKGKKHPRPYVLMQEEIACGWDEVPYLKMGTEEQLKGYHNHLYPFCVAGTVRYHGQPQKQGYRYFAFTEDFKRFGSYQHEGVEPNKRKEPKKWANWVEKQSRQYTEETWFSISTIKTKLKSAETIFRTMQDEVGIKESIRPHPSEVREQLQEIGAETREGVEVIAREAASKRRQNRSTYLHHPVRTDKRGRTQNDQGYDTSEDEDYEERSEFEGRQRPQPTRRSQRRIHDSETEGYDDKHSRLRQRSRPGTKRSQRRDYNNKRSHSRQRSRPDNKRAQGHHSSETEDYTDSETRDYTGSETEDYDDKHSRLRQRSRPGTTSSQRHYNDKHSYSRQRSRPDKKRSQSQGHHGSETEDYDDKHSRSRHHSKPDTKRSQRSYYDNQRSHSRQRSRPDNKRARDHHGLETEDSDGSETEDYDNKHSRSRQRSRHSRSRQHSRPPTRRSGRRHDEAEE